MTPERRHAHVGRIAILFFASFLLPIGWIPFGGCIAALYAPFVVIGSGCPALLLAWSANVLLFVGLVALRAGDNRRAAWFGVSASAASLLAAPFAISLGTSKVSTLALEGLNILGELGYIAWVLAMFALAAVGSRAATDDLPENCRVQAQLRWLMIAGAMLAVGLAGWPTIAPVLYRNWTADDGFNLNGSIGSDWAS